MRDRKPVRSTRPTTVPGNRLGLSALGARAAEPPISWLMDQALAHPHLISLAAGFTDNPSLPTAEVRSIFGELFKNPAAAQSALQYGNTAGDRSLREVTVDRLRILDQATGARVRAELYDADRVIMTHGSQQMLYLLTEVLFDPGDIVLVEDPTYFVFLGMAQSHGLNCRGVRMTPEGIDVDHLEWVLNQLKRTGQLSRLKMLYLVSYHQNPSGITTVLDRKAAALRLLRRFEKDAGHPIYLLEDAAYRDLRFAGEDVASCLTLPGAERRVIYAGTYSKPFATGIRVGYGWLPKALGEVVLRFKGNHDFGTAHVLQQVLARAVQSGRFATHLARLQKRYREKAAVMGRALADQCGDLLEWSEPEGGLYYWAKLRGRGRSGPGSRLFKAALTQEMLYVPGRLCYAADPTRPQPDHELRLSFGNAPETGIEEGIARLARALKSLR